MQPVADAARLDPLGAERAAEPVHVDLQRLLRGRRRILAPHRIDEPVARHDFARLQEERREQRALLRSPEWERASVDEDRDRPEHPELDRPPIRQRQADLKRPRRTLS